MFKIVNRKWLVSLMLVVLLSALWLGLDTTLAQGPQPAQPSSGSPSYSFTYQGRLLDGGVPANGSYDLRVSIWDSEAGGHNFGGAVDYPDWPVSNGLVQLYIEPTQLNTVFTGDPRWLQIEMRPGASAGAFTTLSRQPITPAPYAWGLAAGAAMTSTPTAWDGWVMRVAISGTYPVASAVLADAATGAALRGNSSGGSGLSASTQNGYAVSGFDTGSLPGRGYGGYFSSDNGVPLFGLSHATRYYTNMWAPGVYGRSDDGVGVYGLTDSAAWWIPGVMGEGPNSIGVYGKSVSGVGVQGSVDATSGLNVGVFGSSRSNQGQGGHFSNVDLISGSNLSQTAVWLGTYWGNLIEGWELDGSGNPLNRRFRVSYGGTVYADGSYNCGLGSSCFNTGIGADVAERIDTRGAIGPGDVVEIDPAGDGQFRLTSTPFSTLVAGVASTDPAVTLNNNDLANNDSGVRTDKRPLLALVGQVPVKVTAENGAIQPGDLLVTSSTPGYAMRAGSNPPPGSIIGKALQKSESERGVIKMLVMLR